MLKRKNSKTLQSPVCCTFIMQDSLRLYQSDRFYTIKGYLLDYNLNVIAVDLIVSVSEFSYLLFK